MPSAVKLRIDCRGLRASTLPRTALSPGEGCRRAGLLLCSDDTESTQQLPLSMPVGKQDWVARLLSF
jgi:hypothetical protein